MLAGAAPISACCPLGQVPIIPPPVTAARNSISKVAFMSKLWSLLSIGILAGMVGACSSSGRTNLFSPGPAPYQQRQAERFDPYAEKETGPEIVGARPRDYQKPPSEPSRARWMPWNWSR